MKVVFELDLMDDPIDVRVELTCGSVDEYDRLKRLYPANPDSLAEGERTYDFNGARYYVTTAWTGAKGRVELQFEEPKALDHGDASLTAILREA